MKTDVITFNDLFYQNVQYQVPNFQREYVWTLEGQWEELWEDIQATAEEYLQHLSDASSEADAQQRTRRHFMGAVVIQQKLGTIAGTKKCLIIDGQQRLTTVQLLLRAVVNVINDDPFNQDAINLEQLIVNQHTKAEDQLKLRPSDRDRESFNSVMISGVHEFGASNSQVVAAYIYFREQVKRWLSENNLSDLSSKVHALETALLGLFELVTIDLTPDDDPNIIFEVLNARGTPLSPSDLIKNHILHAAAMQDKQDEIYTKYWNFEDDWWREEVRQGALVRTQLDIFLNYWLASVMTEEVKSNRVYPKFTEYVKDKQESDELTISEIAQEIQRYSQIYRQWNEYESSSVLGRFFYRGAQCGLGGMSPLILWLFSRPNEILPQPELFRIVSHLESFLVRRALCRVITAGLNRLSITLLRQIRNIRGDEIAVRLSNALATAQGPARWPTDDEVEQALLNQPLYGRVGVPKIRMILAALEQKRRDTDPFAQASVLPDVDKLTIEHILPHSWREHWPLPDTEDHTIGEIKRDRLVDTLGNLTLLTDKLNAHVSNGPWRNKRASLEGHPGLYLNHELSKLESWSDRSISKRGQQLLDDVLAIWPHPYTSR